MTASLLFAPVENDLRGMGKPERERIRETLDALWRGDANPEVEKTGRPALVVRNGRPVAALVAIDKTELEDFVLASAPEYARGMADANAALLAGRTREADDLFAQLDSED